MESAAADVHRALQFSEDPALGLPCNAVGKTPLDLEAFFALHPGVYRAHYLRLGAWNGAGCAREASAGDLCDEPPLFRNRDASPLFGESLTDGSGSKSNLSSDLAELSLAQHLRRVRQRSGSLQLRGSR